MKRKRIILITLISLAAVIVIIFSAILLSGNEFTVARCISTENDSLFMVYGGRPIQLSGLKDKDYSTGDKLLILHANAFAESYPEQARTVFVIRLAKGELSDVPDTPIETLTELGYVIDG